MVTARKSHPCPNCGQPLAYYAALGEWWCGTATCPTRPGPLPEPPPAPAPPARSSPGGNGRRETPPIPSLAVIDASQMAEPGPRQWRVDGLLPEGFPAILYGDGGQGKSYLALAAAMAVATGLDLEPSRLTLSDYLSRWLAAVRPNIAPSTYRYYQALLNRQVVPYIGGILLAKLRPLHVQGLYARLHEAGRVDGKGGLSGRTLLHVHRVLSEALGQAVRWQMVVRNVCEAVEAPQASRRELRVLSPEETRRLLDVAAVEDNTWGDAVILAVHSGLRRGELLGLRWNDVDLERASLTVRRSLQYLPGDGLTFREPKTAREQP